MGFKQLKVCTCIFIYKDDVVLVYDYVDDFIITGNSREVVRQKITKLRGKAVKLNLLKMQIVS